MKTAHILIAAILLTGCTQKSDADMYTHKSTELITQILSKEENACCCVVVAEKTIVEMYKEENQGINIEKRLTAQLNLQSKSDLEQAVNQSKIFNLDNFKPNRRIVIMKRSKFDSILDTRDPKHKTAVTEKNWSKIYQLCPNGVKFLSKPVFNKTYTTAYVDLNSGGFKTNPQATYKLKNGSWTPIN